jgi:diketogulonate reductase-like aldo/keto reductase
MLRPSTAPGLSRREFVRDGLWTLAAGPAIVRSNQRSMLTRAIPSSGETVPAIGMGTWQTFDPPDTGEKSLAPLAEVFRIFHDAGGRVVDSSPMYGKSERVTGLLSERLRINPSLFVATKVWTQGEQAGVRQMERSRAELRRERLELMQVHNLVDWRTHLATLRWWKERGRVRYIGVTHYQRSAFDELERIVRRERIDFVQLPYSVAVREAEQRLLPACADSGVAVLVNRPFEEGALFGSVRGRALPEFATRFANTWGQAFLKFIVAHPAVTCVIPATSNPRHMQDNVQAGVGPLPTGEERERLARLVAGG